MYLQSIVQNQEDILFAQGKQMNRIVFQLFIKVRRVETFFASNEDPSGTPRPSRRKIATRAKKREREM
jgi:hypothetical protein